MKDNRQEVIAILKGEDEKYKLVEAYGKREITIYWWNGRKRILDFQGSYKEYFDKLGIKISIISSPRDIKLKGIRFAYLKDVISFTIDSFDDIVDTFDLVVRTYLNYIGDKSLFISKYGYGVREYKINW